VRPPREAISRSTSPRIPPGDAREIGLVNHTLARIAGIPLGAGPPNIFTTLGRHRRLFRRWLLFAGALMPGGLLARADTEVVILRVAHNARSEYEWLHHERLALEAGLTGEEIARVRTGPEDGGWTPRQRTLLRAVDELHGERTISDEVWTDLRSHLSDEELIELCMLVGHYEMLAMTLNALAVQPDPRAAGSRSRLARLIARMVARRAGSPHGEGV
jgi:alkylhydroperoxidase family enzyme